jgi:hypothetical protein
MDVAEPARTWRQGGKTAIYLLSIIPIDYCRAATGKAILIDRLVCEIAVTAQEAFRGSDSRCPLVRECLHE